MRNHSLIRASAPRRGRILFATAAVATILTGPIAAQVIPAQATTRAWDGGGSTAAGVFNWGDGVNWAGDVVPTPDQIVNFNLNVAGIQNIDLGGVLREAEGIRFSVNSAANLVLQNGQLSTNSIQQTADDPNAINATVSISTKNSGADILGVHVTSNTLQLQGLITSGGLVKTGGGVLRLGTSGTNFVNAIAGDIVLAQGTLVASGNNTALGNPLGGTGVFRTAAVGGQLTLDTTAALDFGRDIVVETANLSILNQRFSGTVTNAEQRVGTVTIGNGRTLRVFHNATSVGFFTGSDGIVLNPGATATIQVDTNGRLETDSLTGNAASRIVKTGANELRIRGDNAATFAGDLELRDGTLRLDAVGTNPIGNASTQIIFGGLGTLQLRSDAAFNYVNDLTFSPGVLRGALDVNRIGGTATNQALSVGTVQFLNNTQLNVAGGNSYSANFASFALPAGGTATINPTSANASVASVSGDAASTLVKIGASSLTMNGDNTSTFLGSVAIRGGAVVSSSAGALGTKAVILGGSTSDSRGYLDFIGRLNAGGSNLTSNAVGEDYVVHAASEVDLNFTPGADDSYRILDGGIIAGTSGQLSALTVGGNLTLENGAVIAYENAPAGTPAGIGTNPEYYLGLANALSANLTVGAGTPWKGISNDQAGRTLNGVDAITPVVITANGDDDAATIEVTLQGLNGATLSFGTTAAGDGTYNWASGNAQRYTLAVRGLGGGSIALNPGGNVALEDSAATTLLASAVDKIHVQSGTLVLGADNALGGVPVDVQGALDIRTAAALDGNIAIKSGGILLLNDGFQIAGTGTIAIEGGGKLDIAGAPANILQSTQAISFTGSGHTVRFSANDVLDLDANVPDAGVTYVVSGGAAAAVIAETNINATLNTQTAGLTLENGILTNDGTSRGFAGPLNLNNSNLTVAATRGTTFVVTSAVSTTGTATIGSETAIDFRFKNDPNFFRNDGLFDAVNTTPQVVFTAPFQASALAATGSNLAFTNAATNISGDLNFQGNVLYLDGGGPVAGTQGDLTPRLTDTSGLAANRVAGRILLGNSARVEMSVTSDATGTTNHTITQPFVVEGQVNVLDKRTFWVNRGTGAAATNVLFSDITLRPGAHLSFQESNTNVRSSAILEGDATFVRNSDWDIRSVTKAAGAPGNVTLSIGQPTTVPGGSNGVLIQTVDGTIQSGITVDVVRGQLFFEGASVLDGVVRAQTAPVGGESFLVSRSSGSTSPTTLSGSGEIQIGASAAAAGPEEFEVRGTEVASGPAPLHTVAVPVRVVNDGIQTNIDGILRSERHNDAAVTASTQINTVNVDPGASVQLISMNLARLALPQINLGANSEIVSTNNTSVFLGNIGAGAETIRLSGPALARITGNVTAGQVNITGAGVDFDPGASNTSTMNAPVSLSGLLQVRSGTADLGSNIIAGSAVQTVAGLRENKTQGAFDEATVNYSNQISLGTTYGQLPANVWGENQTVTYTGQIFIPDNGTPGDGFGSVSFAKWFDDNVKVVIDGQTYLRNTTFDDGVSSGEITLSEGWHDIEIRFGQGTGGAGPTGADGGIPGLGFGMDITTPVQTATGGGLGTFPVATNFVAPVDNGSQNLFRTTTVKSSVNLFAGTTLNAGGFTQIGAITATGAGSFLNLAAAGTSDTDGYILGTGASHTLNVGQAGATANVNSSAIVPSGATLTKAGAGSLVFNSSADIDGTLRVIAGSVVVNANGTAGAGVIDVDGGSVAIAASGSHGGSATVDGGALTVNGSLGGGVTLTSGTLGGEGIIGGTIEALLGGTISPGNSPGILTADSLSLGAGATLSIELGKPGAGSPPVAGMQYDQLAISGAAGSINLGGVAGDSFGATLSLIPYGVLEIGDIFTIILNTTPDVDTGTFQGLANGSTISAAGYEFQISYFDNPVTPGFEVAPGSGSSVSLLVTVPEPSVALALLGGIGMLGFRRHRRH
jgi:hypothetical protein